MPRAPTFATDRIVLRPASPGDLADLVALNADPEVMRYIGSGQVSSPRQSAFWLECMLADARHGSPHPEAPEGLPGWLTIIERQTQDFIGLACLSMLPANQIAAIGDGFLEKPAVEVGYRLARNHWGKGYASEAASLLTHYGLEELNLPQVVGIADIRNLASNRVLEKAGLQLRHTYELNGIQISFRSAPVH